MMIINKQFIEARNKEIKNEISNTLLKKSHKEATQSDLQV